MSAPKLVFTRMHHVPTWATEIESGWGTELHYKDSLMECHKVLFFPDGGEAMMVYPNRVFTRIEQANAQLDYERKDLKDYYTKMRDQSIEKLKQLEP